MINYMRNTKNPVKVTEQQWSDLVGEENMSLLKELLDYYEGGQWLLDYQADERGELPPELKRGVLSQDGVWETNIFGKSVEQIVEDGMQAKISQMTEDCQTKLQDTLQKIINDSNGGMICIII